MKSLLESLGNNVVNGKYKIHNLLSRIFSKFYENRLLNCVKALKGGVIGTVIKL